MPKDHTKPYQPIPSNARKPCAARVWSVPPSQPVPEHTNGKQAIKGKNKGKLLPRRDNYTTTIKDGPLRQSQKPIFFVAGFECALSMLPFYFKNRFVPGSSIFIPLSTLFLWVAGVNHCIGGSRRPVIIISHTVPTYFSLRVSVSCEIRIGIDGSLEDELPIVC